MAKEIPITGTDLVAIVDDEDYFYLMMYNWHLSGKSYASNNTLGYMHLVIARKLGFKDECDHRDRNPLNNQRNNLRAATSTQNKQNMSKRSNTSSRFKGVYYYARYKKWTARIVVNKATIFLGNFKNEVDAARAYNNKAKFYFGEFAVLNDIGE